MGYCAPDLLQRRDEAMPVRSALAGALVAAAMSGPATAQAKDDPVERLRSCSEVKLDLERLRCFDDFARSLLDEPADPAKAAQAAPSPPEWRTVEDRSPIDDSLQVSAFRMTSHPPDSPAMLAVRCREKRTEILVTTDDFWGSSQGLRVVYRVNDTPAVEQTWNPASSGKGVFLKGDPVRFLRTLPTTGRLFIRVHDFRGIPHDATFDLDGLGDVLTKIGEACKWPVALDRPAAPKR